LFGDTFNITYYRKGATDLFGYALFFDFTQISALKIPE